jgi:hypothetical protein
LVGGLHPGHLAGTGAYVWARHVDCCSDGVLFGEADGVVAGELFDLSGGVVTGVDADASLCAAVGQVDDGALDGHETGEGFDLLDVHVLGVAGSAFGW